MKIIIIPAKFSKYEFILNKLFGFLLQVEQKEKTDKKISEKVKKLLHQNLDPFLLSTFPNENILANSTMNSWYATLVARIFTFLSLKSFLFVRLLSCFQFSIFNTTKDAILFYRNLYPKNQKKLCLPRSLFAACTSKSFKNEGAIFIGVFLPSRSMHAWIIEKDYQPDPYDDIWICYHPLAIMYK